MEKRHIIAVTVHICPKSRTDVNCNGIQPMESSPSAKGWMLGKPHSLALFKQQVLEQSVNSNSLPAPAPVKPEGNPGSDTPSHRPRTPDSDSIPHSSRKQKRQRHPQHQIRKSSSHKLLHSPRAAQHPVGYQLSRDHKIKRRQNLEKLLPGMQRFGRRSIQKQQQQIFSKKYIQKAKRETQHPYQLHSGPEAFPDACVDIRADILRCEIRDPVADRSKRGNHQIVQLHRGGIPGSDTDTEAVDPPLDQDIADGYKGLLQDAWNCDDGQFF